MESENAVRTWVSDVCEQSHLEISKINFNKSEEWFFSEGGWLQHRSGRFFQVAGVRWVGKDGVKLCQPIIVQQEVGILGFILNDFQLLVQAKVEPGNVGATQLAPTCQATASNLQQIHSGKAPLFSELFLSPCGNLLHDSMQSEQGSRFLGKFNRNMLLQTNVHRPLEPAYCWLPVDAVLELAKADFLMNTDARSVMVCSPWEQLVKRSPFTRFTDSYSCELADSFSTTSTYQSLTDMYKTIHMLRSHIYPPELVRLDELDGWVMHDDAIISLKGRPFHVLQIDVRVDGREVANWDQPMISSAGNGYVELVCGRKDGILFFLFVFQIEVGLQNKVELGPTLLVEPGETISNCTYLSFPGAIILTECQQSDEGGRFYHDISMYRMVDVGLVFEPPENGYWLTLSQISKLLREGGWFTNEARSMLSLLLPWL